MSYQGQRGEVNKLLVELERSEQLYIVTCDHTVIVCEAFHFAFRRFVRPEPCPIKDRRGEVNKLLVELERSEQLYLVTCDHTVTVCEAFPLKPVRFLKKVMHKQYALKKNF